MVLMVVSGVGVGGQWSWWWWSVVLVVINGVDRGGVDGGQWC